jgi:hypothetical protein
MVGYEDIGEAAFGPRGRSIVSSVVYTELLGTCALLFILEVRTTRRCAASSWSHQFESECVGIWISRQDVPGFVAYQRRCRWKESGCESIRNIEESWSSFSIHLPLSRSCLSASLPAVRSPQCWHGRLCLQSCSGTLAPAQCNQPGPHGEDGMVKCVARTPAGGQPVPAAGDAAGAQLSVLYAAGRFGDGAHCVAARPQVPLLFRLRGDQRNAHRHSRRRLHSADRWARPRPLPARLSWTCPLPCGQGISGDGSGGAQSEKQSWPRALPPMTIAMFPVHRKCAMWTYHNVACLESIFHVAPASEAWYVVICNRGI